jgi:Flp pilus assembly pilin Flp
LAPGEFSAGKSTPSLPRSTAPSNPRIRQIALRNYPTIVRPQLRAKQFRHGGKKLMSAIMKAYARVRENKGQTMAEYGLIVALVAVVTVAAWGLLGGSINGVLTTINGAL